MATLSVSTLDLPVASLGPPSPYAMFATVAPVGSIDAAVPSDVAERARYGAAPSLYPYTAQDDYGRELLPGSIRVAVLENDSVRAIVALDFGGRLWSLFDKVDDRELLYVNPVLQPANLALRNAWFSGGVEWNIGTRGHCPFTMSTLHAAKVERADGTPVLRLWEFERLREVVFQVDLWLPDDAPVLAATVRIRNPNAETVPMYWWTNAAVVCTEGTRVLAPTTTSLRTDYPAGITVAAVPDDGDGDNTYPAHRPHAVDYFYDLAPPAADHPSMEGSSEYRKPRDGTSDTRATADTRMGVPWIAAVEADGRGVAQVSTPLLRGRKFFAWGGGAGGGQWQRWLSHGGAEQYAEIQAGLAPTQFEHLPMPAGASWSWTEVFAPVHVDSEWSHGSNWAAATAHVGGAIEAVVPAALLADWRDAAESEADTAPMESLATGSGWGALERHRRAANGATWIDECGTPFGDDTIGDEQALWLGLLEGGTTTTLGRSSFVSGDDWDRRLAAIPETSQTLLRRGLIALGAGDHRAAIEHLDRAAQLDESAVISWARAEAHTRGGNQPEAARAAVAAATLEPDDWRLATAALVALLDIGHANEALDLVASMPVAVAARGRIRLLHGFAAVAAGRPEAARAALLAGLEIADLREGERSIDELWLLALPGRDLPAEYDFGMR